MLVFEQITLTTSQPVFKPSQLKHIRFSYNSVTTRSKHPAQILTSQKLKWTNNINYPIIYNKQIEFQIFDQHQFGYNPEEFAKLIKGKFTIAKGETYKCDIEVITADTGTSIGKLQVKFRITSIIPQKVQNIMPKNEKLIIKSIIAHLPSLSNKKIYISIKIGDSHKQTPIIKSHKGEVVITQNIEIDKSSFIKEAVFNVYLIEDRGNQVKSIAEGVLELKGTFVERKVDLKDHQDSSMGILFINARTITTKKKDYSSVGKIMFSTIDPSKLTRYHQTIPQTSRVSRNSSYRTYNSTNTPNLHPSPSSSILNSRMSINSQRTKKITVIHQNNEIVFPKEERFKLYQDKQSNYISYLEDMDQMGLKEKHSGKFYRGASIGYGEKTDFVHKGSPGIGRYKLPSIWDRY